MHKTNTVDKIFQKPFIYLVLMVVSLIVVNTFGFFEEKPVLASCHANNRIETLTEDTTVFLPVIKTTTSERSEPIQSTRKINVPYFSNNISFSRMGISWFGELSPVDNYTDIRVGYSDDELQVALTIFDQFLFYDLNPGNDDLRNWDTASLYLSLEPDPGSGLQQSDYLFVAQVNHWQPREDYQIAYQGSGNSWTASNTPFTTEVIWRGEGFNDVTKPSKGWVVKFHIPFDSLGLNGPAHDATWRLGLTVHDRDDAVGTPISDKKWPEAMDGSTPDSWGVLHFGVPQYQSPTADYDQTTVVRHGFDGVQVEDAHVGGGFTCGDYVDYWSVWPNRNLESGENSQINIQNQLDVSDYPCFSKYYVTFPLDMIPEGAQIVSASLTMHQFGSSGTGWDDEPQPSYIQILAINEDWEDTSITWNNAPQAYENFAGTLVDPLPVFPGWPGIPHSWDVSQPLANALSSDNPLRLALYSSDAAIHSGKYFYSSDSNSDGSGRPYLTVNWKYP